MQQGTCTYNDRSLEYWRVPWRMFLCGDRKIQSQCTHVSRNDWRGWDPFYRLGEIWVLRLRSAIYLHSEREREVACFISQEVGVVRQFFLGWTSFLLRARHCTWGGKAKSQYDFQTEFVTYTFSCVVFPPISGSTSRSGAFLIFSLEQFFCDSLVSGLVLPINGIRARTERDPLRKMDWTFLICFTRSLREYPLF